MPSAGFFTGRNSYEACGVDYAIAFRALAYCISAAMCVAVMALTPRRRIPLASAFGPRTLQVYVWHGTALTLLGVTGAQAAIEASFGSFGFLVFVALAIPVALLLSAKPFGVPLKPFLSIAPKKDRAERAA